MEDAPEDSSATSSFNPSPNGFFGSDDIRNTPKVGLRKVGLRAEIDTSPPFGSVKEAVEHFESNGPWVHLHRLRLALGDNAYLHDVGEIDIKKVEEQTLELEKNLIMKELETLDVLEELGTTKRIVEDLKWQLRKEASKSSTTPDLGEQVSTSTLEEFKAENSVRFLKNDGPAVGSSSPCPNTSPDLLLLELNQAKMNLGKTINELGWIQTSVDSLNKKIKKEKALLEKNRQRLTSKPAGASLLRGEPKHQRMKSDCTGADKGMYRRFPNDSEEIVDESATFGAPQTEPETQEINPHMKTAEMRLIAAKKMEEAARAAEAVALAEIKALSSQEDSMHFPLPEPETGTFSRMQHPLASKPQKRINPARKNAEEATAFQLEGPKNSRLGILKTLEHASEEVKLSKQALEEALKRIDIANRKQLAAGEALRNYSIPADHPLQSQIVDMNHSTKPEPPIPNEEPKPVLRSTISMRDVLSRKQVLPRDYAERRETECHKVALSQVLNELREDISCPTKVDENRGKQFISQRKRFGFIHISFPLSKQSKKNMPPSDRK